MWSGVADPGLVPVYISTYVHLWQTGGMYNLAKCMLSDSFDAGLTLRINYTLRMSTDDGTKRPAGLKGVY